MENHPKRPLPSGPFPIFAGKVQQANKRPRVALYTHPNNIMQPTTRGGEKETTQQYSFNPSRKKHNKENNYQSGMMKNYFQQQDNKEPPTSRSYYTHQRRDDLPPFPPPLPPPLAPPPPPSHSRNTPIKQGSSTQKRSHQTTLTHQGTISQSNFIGTSASATPPTRVRPTAVSTRVVTTTGYSIQQWVSMTTSGHQHVIYEIFGVVTSPVLPGDFGSKKFLLKTLKGTIKCHYWEMDSQVPLVCTRGKHHRVMGIWDRKNNILKCVSVRLTTQEEEQFLPQILQASECYLKHLNTASREQ